MFEKDQKIRHKKSGQVVTFLSVRSSHRGVTKVHTSGPWGALDVREFEAIEDSESEEDIVPASKPKTTPTTAPKKKAAK
jgi:hypothetical protein